MEFNGYRRPDGCVGTRNYVGILSTVVCANEVADGISRQVQGTACFMHQQGCCQTPIDIQRVNDTIVGLGRNPNLAAVLLVSLGCESTVVEDVAARISAAGKRVDTVVIQEVGGAARSIAEGVLLAQEMVQEASQLRAVSCGLEDIVLGLKCGSSDTTSGLAPNPALGIASDLVVKGGGHSYHGTSCAPDSLLVWTRAMNAVTLHDAFVARGCEGVVAPQPAVSVGAGARWLEAYDAVTTRGGRYVQGGGCTTVGVAGLVQSGGFGSFSKRFGTAAAGLLEAEVVTADGVARIANACTNPGVEVEGAITVRPRYIYLPVFFLTIF